MFQRGTEGCAMHICSFENGAATGGCRYGLFGRAGGESGEPFTSLNVGLQVGDDSAAVLLNRSIIKNKLGAEILITALQVHGNRVHVLKGLPEADLEVDGCDALITDIPNVGLMIQHADCQPVLIYDRVAKAIGAVHSGWRGSVQNIIGGTVERMHQEYGSKPEDLQVVVGPSLGPCCAEFIHYRKELPESFWDYKDENSRFDFWQISKLQLMNVGVREGNITLPSSCTACSDKYFSYRNAVRTNGGITGRNGSVIILRKENH